MKTTKNGQLNRTTFRTSRLLDFCSHKELVAQTGHKAEDWPLVALKELLDNALDACEDAGIPPVINISVGKDEITVTDNGPGIPHATVAGVLDFAVRVSNREAYASPTRGAQGNGLKTLVAMPFVLDGEKGKVEITAKGTTHTITMGVDRIKQEPVIDHQQHHEKKKPGTSVRLHWPFSARSNDPHKLNGKSRFLLNGDDEDEEDDDFSPSSKGSILENAKARFLLFADDYAFLNPHLSLGIDWSGEKTSIKATDKKWTKWLPSDPTSPHWYQAEHLERLIAAYVSHDAERKQDRTVRALVSEFRGFTGSAALKKILESTGLARLNLSELVKGQDLDKPTIARLLDAMKKDSKPVKPAALGIIGKDHLANRFESMGAEMKSYQYKKVMGETDGRPWIAETAFAWCPNLEKRRLVTGVNFSPGIINPFREMGKAGQSLDTILEKQRGGREEPVILVLHMAAPRVEYTDRGKSAVVMEK